VFAIFANADLVCVDREGRKLWGLNLGLPDNPYGFAWHRRVNESNVDVNRNFLQRFDPDLCNEDYERLNAELNPPDLDPANEAARWARIDAFTAEHGPRRLQQAAFAGQYRYP
jgi:hypothetical protein